MENHRTVLPTKATIRGKGKSDETSLKGRDESYTLDRAQNSICTPLAKKIMTTPGRDKKLKEERQIKTKTLIQSSNKTWSENESENKSHFAAPKQEFYTH